MFEQIKIGLPRSNLFIQYDNSYGLLRRTGVPKRSMRSYCQG